jgi:hypothetical protein
MSVVLFSESSDQSERKQLEAALKKAAARQLLEVFTKFEDFSARIRRLPIGIDVAVLSIQNDYQLTALLSLSEYLYSVRIILVLPEQNDHMVNKGHLFHPRFVAFKNSDVSNIAAVLSKMIRNASHRLN